MPKTMRFDIVMGHHCIKLQATSPPPGLVAYFRLQNIDCHNCGFLYTAGQLLCYSAF